MLGSINDADIHIYITYMRYFTLRVYEGHPAGNYVVLACVEPSRTERITGPKQPSMVNIVVALSERDACKQF